MIYRVATAATSLLLAAASMGAASAADLTILVNGLRNDQGVVSLCIFAEQSSNVEEFPDCEKGKPVKTATALIRGGQVMFTYNGLKEGNYAVALIHDENKNGKLDTNFLGIPREGIGVSNNPVITGKPTFTEARFTLDKSKTITITAKYFL